MRLNQRGGKFSGAGLKDDLGGSVTRLTAYNFVQWKHDIDMWCLRKGKTDENVKIAFLYAGLSGVHSIMLRKAMAVETAKLDNDREYKPVLCVKVSPYQWAMQYLQEIVMKGATTSNKVLRIEQMRNELAQMRIESCNFDLRDLYERFQAKVTLLAELGVVIEEVVLALYFRRAVRNHRDLAVISRVENEDLTVDELFIQYERIISEESASRRQSNKRMEGKHAARAFNSRAIGMKCFNCGKMGHRAADCEEERSLCKHCGKPGHDEATCWKLHPELSPNNE